MIEREWGSIENFKQFFAKQSTTLQGVGWAWLVYNKAT
jgi:superoxide dismutase